MKQILCPVDFSDASLNALEFAVEIGEKSQASIHLIHVVTPDEYADNLAEDTDTIEEVNEEPQERLRLLEEEVRQRNTSVSITTQVVDGELMDKLEEVISEMAISLVVMGTEGANSLREEWIGSNTIKLIEDSDVPVLCVPLNSGFSNMDNIVFGSDFSSTDKETLRFVISFGLLWKANISVIHIARSESALQAEGYEEYVHEMESYFPNDALAFEQYITDDEVPIALEHMLNEYQADLLVLVHKHRNFLESIFHRSVTKKMSYLTNFPLLILRD